MSVTHALRIAAATLTVACAPSFASVIFQQTPASSVGNAWTSHVAPGVGGYKAFDNFEVDRNASVNHVSWRGTYFDISGGGLAGGAPNTNTWTVEFWSGDAAGPSARLYQASATPADVERTSVGTGDFGAGAFTVYDFALDLAADFEVVAGQSYWISIVSFADAFNPLFSWTNAESGGSTFQQLLAGSGGVLTSFVRGGDRAFALSGHSVPEPASLGLAAVALLAARLARRRA